MLDFKPCRTLPLRLLDHELKLHCKAMDESFDPKKLSFVLEARGVVQEAEIVKAQGKIQSAFKQSLVAGFKLFETNLESDQIAHRRHLLAASGDQTRARAAIVSSLEDSLQGQGLVWRIRLAFVHVASSLCLMLASAL